MLWRYLASSTFSFSVYWTLAPFQVGRYKYESKDYIRGKYGKTPGLVSPELISKLLGDEKPIQVRPTALLEPEYEKLSNEISGYARTEEDILTYAMFPALGKDYLIKKYAL